MTVLDPYACRTLRTVSTAMEIQTPKKSEPERAAQHPGRRAHRDHPRIILPSDAPYMQSTP